MALQLGRFNGKCINATLGVTANGKQQIEIVCEFGKGSANEGKTGSAFLSLEKGAALYTLRTLYKALGWRQGMPFSELHKVGREFEIEVASEPSRDGGRVFQKLAIWPLRAGLQTPEDRRLSGTEERDVMDLVMERVKREQEGKAEQDDDAPPLDNDDMPF